MRSTRYQNGSALLIVIVSLIILVILGSGMLTVAYGVRHKAIRLKNETISMLAAEAGYEQAVFWMSQQPDMLSALQDAVPGTTGALVFPDGDCNYQIELYSFLGYRPVYKVVSVGHSGMFDRTVEVQVVQAISGWDMGACEVPTGSTSSSPVYFADGEIIDMPLQINDQEDSPDERDIHISGSPEFMQAASMGESRYAGGGADKYKSVMDCFENGIYFDQPDSRVTDTKTVQSKVDRFKDSTKLTYTFDPKSTASVSSPHAAVQVEFFVEDNVGKVRVTNDCTVLGYQRNSDYKTYDYEIKPSSSEELEFRRYDTYAYHYMPKDAEANGQRFTVPIEETYVTQSFGGVESEPGGQIFVDGDVVIGGDLTTQNGDQVVKGNITVVATGNIWIADSIVVDGAHEADGKPSIDNPNILGLIAQGVIKVVDPGISEYDAGGTSAYPGPPAEIENTVYAPIGREDPGQWKWKRVDGKWEKVYEPADVYERHLPDEMIVEAAMTVGGGGWGAENVRRGYYGGRKEASGNQDQLIVRGTIVEAVRGVVGLVGGDGFLKNYYFDERILEGILPGDIWLRGKYIPAPAGWHDYRPDI
jgi:type II secretory pathway pseudopilin PulG